MKKNDPRALAVSMLVAWEEQDRYINLSLTSPAVSALEPADRRFLTALVYGTVERSLTLDFRIGRLCGRPASSLRPHTRALLRVGLYQLGYMEVPPHAALNETVSCAADPGERALVNAVLRTALREPEKTALPPREKNPARYLSLYYSFPLPVVRHFLALCGEAETEKILAAFNETQPLTLRVNTCRIGRDALLARLRDAGVAAGPTAFSPVGIRLAESTDPTALPGFADGLFFVQDEASQIAVAALGARGGSFAVDTCACPGGKTCGIAMDMGDAGRVLALDLHESKLPLIAQNAARCGLHSVETAVHDGTTPLADLGGKADAVLCDAPCSGLGVLGKKADLRYRAGVREDLPDVQGKILASAASYVRPGGTLVYSTCTLNERENGGVCREFLKNHPEFTACGFSCGALSSDDGMLTLWPHVHHTDGFFVAKFRRVKGEDR